MNPKTERQKMRRKGLLALRRGKLDDAIELLTGCLALLADDVPARVALGAAYSRKKWHDKALEMFERAAKTRPMSVDVHYDWAKALARAGRYKEAVRTYQRVLKLNPEHPKAANKIAKIKQHVKKYRDRQQAASVQPKPAAQQVPAKPQQAGPRVLSYDSKVPPPPSRQRPKVGASSAKVKAVDTAPKPDPDFAAAVEALAIEPAQNLAATPPPQPAQAVAALEHATLRPDPYAPWQSAPAPQKKSQTNLRPWALLTLGIAILAVVGILVWQRPWSSIAPESVESSVPKKPGGADAELVTRAVADLKSPTAARRKEACELLCKLDLKEGREDLARKLEPLLRDPDVNTRAACAKSLGALGSLASVPALLAQLANDEFGPARREEMLALGKLKDDRAVEPLAQRLSHADDREAAGQSLEAMGPMAEKKVLDYLRYPELPVRIEACRILGQIGGPASIRPLEAIQNDANSKLAEAATAALKSIRERK